ncbi:sterigmatocystin 8-o-methyltransferase precursor [Stemphylium lycopersici]|uniref:Sterigmatocystin 8-o-methyltransferase n=1 Tax=Stemphylium lycopersici TaxID=183478 RepID=A0A364MVJ9_STELY|nr:sterigmatocystin 8-o-methyltransferase precursor [Stemphylium lycopersici]RAR04919.1 sterigmatocystin 8-o-methyltransferase precursor [Stemphylium lycopersici]
MAVQQDDVSIASLADRVSALSKSITSYIDTSGYGQPNFTRSSPAVPETAEYEALRNQLNDAVLDLHRLVNGPKNLFRTQGYSCADAATTQVALSRKYFEHVPADDTGISAAELAEKAGMDEDRTNRFLKMLATQRVFEEVEDKFRHTAASYFLKTSKFAAMADMSYDDTFKAAMEMNKHIEESPFSSGLKNCAWYRKYNMNFYDFLETDPEKALRFSNAMAGWSLVDNSVNVLQNGFDWESLQNKKVVDIGGGNGHISIDLAKHYPSLSFVVQDVSVYQLSTTQSTEIQDRVTFQKYNYFTPQPVRDAAIYFYRVCFHNNNDEESVKMIRAIVPALENRDDEPRLLISDTIVPERAQGAITRSEEHQHRQQDMIMLTYFGGKERTEKNWRQLLEMADKRLEIVNINYSPSGAGLLEIRLKQEPGSVSTP